MYNKHHWTIICLFSKQANKQRLLSILLYIMDAHHSFPMFLFSVKFKVIQKLKKPGCQENPEKC